MKTFKLGEIELKNISCSDCLLSIGFEVESIPDSFLATIQKSIEDEKIALEWHKKHWSDKPVIIDFHTLCVDFSPEKPMAAYNDELTGDLQTIFHDAEDESLEGCGSAYVDLSAYNDYMKNIISDFLFNKFFK